MLTFNILPYTRLKSVTEIVTNCESLVTFRRGVVLFAPPLRDVRQTVTQLRKTPGCHPERSEGSPADLWVITSL